MYNIRQRLKIFTGGSITKKKLRVPLLCFFFSFDRGLTNYQLTKRPRITVKGDSLDFFSVRIFAS